MRDVSRPDERRSNAAGSAALELVVVWMLVVWTISVLIASGIPQTLVDALREAYVCGFGDGCASDPAEATPAKGAEPRPLSCVKTSTENLRTSSTDVLFKRWTSGSRYLVRERSDGAVEILDTTSKGSGHVVAGGAKVGKSKGKLGVSGKATLEKVEEEGVLYVLETPEERERFEAAKTDRAVDAYVDPFAQLKDPAGYERKEIYRMAPFLEGSYKRVSDSGSVDISGGVKILRGGAGVRGETGTVVEENYRTGEKTVSYDVKASGTGEIGALFVGGASSTGEALLTISLTTDAEGAPTRLLLTSETERSLGADLTLDPTRVVDLPSFLQTAAGVSASKSGGVVLRVTAGLELDDPAARAAALRFAEDPTISAGRALLERFDDSGAGLVEVLRTSTSTDGFGAGVALLGSLGFEDEDSVKSLNLESAWGWDPVKGLAQRTDCTR